MRIVQKNLPYKNFFPLARHRVHFIATCGSNKSIFRPPIGKKSCALVQSPSTPAANFTLIGNGSFSPLVKQIATDFLAGENNMHFINHQQKNVFPVQHTIFFLPGDQKMNFPNMSSEYCTFAVCFDEQEISHFPVLKERVKVQLSLGVLGKIMCFTCGEQAIINSCPRKGQ